jgi:hypothetical protein
VLSSSFTLSTSGGGAEVVVGASLVKVGVNVSHHGGGGGGEVVVGDNEEPGHAVPSAVSQVPPPQ